MSVWCAEQVLDVDESQTLSFKEIQVPALQRNPFQGAPCPSPAWRLRARSLFLRPASRPPTRSLAHSLTRTDVLAARGQEGLRKLRVRPIIQISQEDFDEMTNNGYLALPSRPPQKTTQPYLADPLQTT
eukprot:2178828-Rhodomonas_salina.2